MSLVDSHCHLDMLAKKADLTQIINRAKDHGVDYLQTICTNLADLASIIEISQQYDQVFASAGIHPNEVSGLVDHQVLIDLTSHPKIIGLGETGLDYYYQSAEKPCQIASFTQHILAAQKTKLPIIVHTREAEQDTIELLTAQMKELPFSGVIHCFTGSRYLAEKMLDLGMYISISGIITFKNADLLRQIVSFVPLERLLIETDSPYLAPVPWRGKPNEPALVRYVALAIAELKNIELSSVATITTANFFTLFAKAAR